MRFSEEIKKLKQFLITTALMIIIFWKILELSILILNLTRNLNNFVSKILFLS